MSTATVDFDRFSRELGSVTADAIRGRLADLEAEAKALRVILRAVVAKERAAANRRRAESGGDAC